MSNAPDRIPLPWDPGEKMDAMQRWAKSVMADPRLTKGEIAVAWALQFAFNSENGRCWEKNSTIAARAGISDTYAESSIAGLDRKGHIIRAEESIRKKLMRVIRPAISCSGARQPRRTRRGGIQKQGAAVEFHPLEVQSPPLNTPTESQSPHPPEVQWSHPPEVQGVCILESSGMNPRDTVADVGTTAPDWDDDFDDESFPGFRPPTPVSPSPKPKGD